MSRLELCTYGSATGSIGRLKTAQQRSTDCHSQLAHAQDHPIASLLCSSVVRGVWVHSKADQVGPESVSTTKIGNSIPPRWAVFHAG